MSIKDLLAVLFPHLACVSIDRVFRAGTTLRIRARTETRQAECPGCGTVSRRRHSHYERQLSDTAVSGQERVIHLQVHRFFCPDDDCARKTFVEQVPRLTVRYGRRSPTLSDALQAIALALGSRAGARLTERLAAPVSRMTLIRMIRALPDPVLSGAPAVLGVDDFALRRGRVYATVLIDISTGRPIDVLADRSADTLAAWLGNHPGVEIICRDRAGAYAEGAARGAPAAIQVADRWHLWRNLGDAVERTVAKHRASLRELPRFETGPVPAEPANSPAAPDAAPSAVPRTRQDRVAIRTRQRHTEIHDLIAQGLTLREIARELTLGRNTVRRFARAASPEELLVRDGTGKQTRQLDAYAVFLRRRWAEGCTNATQLMDELRACGYQGGPTAVRQYLRPWRVGLPSKPQTPNPPTVRQATRWLLTNPANLDPEGQHYLDALTTACPQLAATRRHVRGFAEMMLHRNGHQQLERWMNDVTACDLPELHSFVTGLRRDQDAVTAGLTLPYSSGPVEGHVNRIKMLKR
ncbi:ISL3 family transposase [Herbidospora mongoliensis]|uniref:ISL3 family transposase n=1 Tax=Herbidospora mongoliensis TaxID=688067 RepID=UPI00082B1A8A|nr:ISL3 family transposase [Herbidospora mongoliensis]